MKRPLTKLFILAALVGVCSYLFAAKVLAQAVLDVNNLVINPTQAANYTYAPPNFAGGLYDNDGYLTVGVGEFNQYNLVLTIESPTPNLTITIIDATICNNVAPGDFSSVDNPSDAADASTFVFIPQFDPINIPTMTVLGVNYDCANRNRTITMNGMTPLATGGYGGIFYGSMGNRAGAHQNSFKLDAGNAGAKIGYVSEVVQRVQANPANAPVLSFIGWNIANGVGINVSNVGQPQFAYSHFTLGMSVPCNSTTNNFATRIGLYDIDDASGAPWDGPTATGGYWQGTAQFPTARLVVFARQKGTNPATGAPYPWSTMANVPVVGPGSGRASEFVTNVGPFQKNYQYQFQLQNITRANAVQFSILDPSANLSTTAYEEPCGEDPVGFADDCEIVGGQTVIYGWAYDNDDAGGPQVQVNLSGIGNQTVTANLSTYASWQNNASINSALNTWGYGSDARDNRYGWSATFSGALSSGNYNLSGTLLNAGSGGNPNLSLPVNGGVFGPGGSLPARCKFTPPPPTVDLDINGADGPLSIFEGDNVNVSWTSTDATGCTASRAPQGASTWAGNKATSSAGENHNADSATLGTFVYNITCTGLGGSGSDSVELTVRQIPNKPYFQVLNGDVSAGAGFGASCSTVATAPISAFNNGAAAYLGAGTRLAAFDLGTVTGFASAAVNGGMTLPKSLTFANTGAGAASTTYGGGLGSNACAVDYYNLPKTNATPWGGSLTNGEWTTSGNQTLAAGGVTTIAPDNKVTLFVNGSVYIRNNILLGTATSYNSMPTFYLIVQGNIYIDYRVTQLDGIYVAQGGSGKIFTCATGFAAPSAAEVASTVDTPGGAICGQNQLTVYGALVANQVKLLRSRSKIENCTTVANCLTESAEIINYTPDRWIPPRTTTPGAAKKYDAITSLPPVL